MNDICVVSERERKVLRSLRGQVSELVVPEAWAQLPNSGQAPNATQRPHSLGGPCPLCRACGQMALFPGLPPLSIPPPGATHRAEVEAESTAQRRLQPSEDSEGHTGPVLMLVLSGQV